ncbi:Coenzyme F420 hydrogenase/dehydrogenase, beta subunit C-terminal domain [uncultured Thiohalocapsa sp.]|uniref:Coenzyme F420 hydrogenase/dehydrogenase, beta subunit C-terminal domain n=1 Tax=uncultured Thiohalocapsa sp. TaxID=768990 RepID=UPI0025E176F0|nr:Coenzyme F420 hydrogenase/dehydrogenase, beta subunit C-terminal domain [uncultured Thiohalocapsa sp.]
MPQDPPSAASPSDIASDPQTVGGPSKGLRQSTLLSRDARLAGRPNLCSDCGLCDTWLKPDMAQACVFVRNRSEEIEWRLFGRNRRDGDELQFGVFQQMLAARLRQPVAGAQWSGMVTTLAARLLERGEVDAVITVGTVPGTRFAPQPVLARTPAEVRATAGNKPCLAPSLGLLDTVRAAGVRRLAVIGTGCQVHMLRAAEDKLGLERLDVIGIPCSDNVTYPDLTHFLAQVSRSPDTIVHYEFMQDYSLHMRHEDGTTERLNYIDFPMDKLEDIFPSACLSCFDYANTLADITIGYMGARLGWQWVLVRTDRGAALLELLRDDLETTKLTSAGDRSRGVPRFIQMLAKPPGKPPKPVRRLIAWLQRNRGPRGLEFARAIIDMKLLRNLHHVRSRFRRFEPRIVPTFVYRALAPYDEANRDALGEGVWPPTTSRRTKRP